jgi:hypothetical protein
MLPLLNNKRSEIMNIGIEELNAATRVIKSGELSGYQGNFSEKFHGGNEVKALE